MRSHGYFTLTLAAIFCLGTFLPVGTHAMGRPLAEAAPSDQQLASTDRARVRSLPVQPLGDASELSSSVADLPTADRRDCDGGRISLPRLSQLPRALCDAAVKAGSTAGGWRSPFGGRLPDDDRPHFSPTLVIEHVRLQI